MTPNSPQSAATEVWRRFAGMFGADALERKYGREIPQEWAAMCIRLNDYQIQRGIRQLAYRAHVPSLPEFVKLCRDAEHDIRPPQQHPALARDEDPSMDPWGLLANRRLMQYISTVVSANPQRYGRPASWEGMKASKEPNADASPEFIHAIGILVAFKNRWADLMRAAATADGVLIADQEAAWNAGMRMAEQEIAKETA
jgi:hypothetical protein